MERDQRTVLVMNVAERLVAELCQPLIDSYLEQIAALEHELDLALARIDQLQTDSEVMK